MAKTFTNEPLGLNFRHACVTEKGHYVMGGSWIDTTCPRDMMDYDFTDTWSGLLAAHAETHRIWYQSHSRMTQ